MNVADGDAGGSRRSCFVNYLALIRTHEAGKPSGNEMTKQHFSPERGRISIRYETSSISSVGAESNDNQDSRL